MEGGQGRVGSDHLLDSPRREVSGDLPRTDRVGGPIGGLSGDWDSAGGRLGPSLGGEPGLPVTARPDRPLAKTCPGASKTVRGRTTPSTSGSAGRVSRAHSPRPRPRRGAPDYLGPGLPGVRVVSQGICNAWCSYCDGSAISYWRCWNRGIT